MRHIELPVITYEAAGIKHTETDALDILKSLEYLTNDCKDLNRPAGVGPIKRALVDGSNRTLIHKILDENS